MPIDLDKTPKGPWIRRAGNTIIIGAILREAIVFNLIFAIFWSLGMLVLPIGLLFGNWIMILVGFPFFLVGIWLWKSALMSLLGHVEIKLDYDQGTVFSGIGKLGRTRTFIYKETSTIDEYIFVRHNNIPKYAIIIEGEKNKPIKFGGYMKEERRAFLIKMLRSFMTDGDKVRDLLPLDLIDHLIE